MKVYDAHVHTNFAYCADDNMTPQSTTAIAKKAGYGICLVEHAWQLYVRESEYWNGRYIDEPHIIRGAQHNRMDEYIATTSKFRGEDVKVGIEVDVDKDGALTLREEHKTGWDIVIGAVHRLPSRFDDDVKSGFLWAVEALCSSCVDVLAHPFRFFSRNNLRVPGELYAPTVRILTEYGVAAELNFHTNEPSRIFFEMCIENDVKISVGSDAHSLFEVCDIKPHFKVLEEICAGKDMDDVLYDVQQVKT